MSWGGVFDSLYQHEIHIHNLHNLQNGKIDDYAKDGGPGVP